MRFDESVLNRSRKNVESIALTLNVVVLGGRVEERKIEMRGKEGRTEWKMERQRVKKKAKMEGHKNEEKKERKKERYLLATHLCLTNKTSTHELVQ